MSGNDDLEVYIFRGNSDPDPNQTAGKLIVSESVQVVPTRLCYDNKLLREVILPYGLISIYHSAFRHCENLPEIKIPSTVHSIGSDAFRNCKRLAKVDFEFSTSSPHHQLRRIGDRAFFECRSLERIKLPSSVNRVGEFAFCCCSALTEANLSTTGVTKVSIGAFKDCSSMQTVSLPNTLERIYGWAFHNCSELVTVVARLGSQRIIIGFDAFNGCVQLANLLLPRHSYAKATSFAECRLLHDRYGEHWSYLITGLKRRFENHAIHRLCCDHSTVAVRKLRKCIAKHQPDVDSLVDEFGMSPFHVLFSTIEPRIELLDVLLESLPNHILNWKDANGRRPLDYLINNWSDGNIVLFQRTLQKWMMDRLARWGATSWKEAMQSKMEAILAEEDKRRRVSLCNEACAAFENYENVQATSILELALWKRKLRSGWTRSGRSKRQAFDRDERRCLSGSDVVISHVTMFLDIPRAASQDE